MTDTTWFIYVLRCADNSLYTGVTTDVQRRFEEHSSNGNKSAKYVRGRGPLTLAATAHAQDKVHAMRAEYAFKKLAKWEKERVVRRGNEGLESFVVGAPQ